MTTDEQWLREVMRCYAQELMNFIRFYTRTASETEDLVQEVFLKAFRGRTSFEGQSHIKTWLWRITIRVCQDYLRRQRRRPLVLRDDINDVRAPHTGGIRFQHSSAESEAMDSICSTELLQYVKQLPEKYRTAILLHYFEGLGIREIAETLQTSSGAVKSRLFRARSELKTMLVAQGGAEHEGL